MEMAAKVQIEEKLNNDESSNQMAVSYRITRGSPESRKSREPAEIYSRC